MAGLQPRLLGRYSLGATICLVAVLPYTITFFAPQVRLYKGLHMQTEDLGHYDPWKLLPHARSSRLLAPGRP